MCIVLESTLEKVKLFSLSVAISDPNNNVSAIVITKTIKEAKIFFFNISFRLSSSEIVKNPIILTSIFSLFCSSTLLSFFKLNRTLIQC